MPVTYDSAHYKPPEWEGKALKAEITHRMPEKAQEAHLAVKTSQELEMTANIPLSSLNEELQAIAVCESGGHHRIDGELVVNHNTNGTIDRGLFQINSIHIPTAEKQGIDITTLEGNIEYAKQLYEKQGTQPWVYSKKCWNKKRTESIQER